MIYNIFWKRCLEKFSGLSVVISTFIEEVSLGELLKRIEVVMDLVDNPYKIIVVDDGCKDKTAEVAVQLECAYLIF